MIKGIARVYKYTPQTIAELYYEDTDDFESICFWFDDAQKYIKEINNANNI